MFTSKPSKLHGFGLFCTTDLKKNEFFKMDIEKIYKIRKIVKNKYLLDFYLPSGFDSDSKCINDNKIELLKNVKFKNDGMKKYASTSSIFMFANDAAWPASNSSEYDYKTKNNNAEFVLCFENQEICGISLLTLKDIQCNSEICVTYGHDFWLSPKIS